MESVDFRSRIVNLLLLLVNFSISNEWQSIAIVFQIDCISFQFKAQLIVALWTLEL